MIDIPRFNPDQECLSIVNDSQGSHFKVVNESSKEKRIESNMKAAQYASDHLAKINTRSPGFGYLIDSIQGKFTKGDFSKNPEFVIAALKGKEVGIPFLIGNLKGDKRVMLSAIKEGGLPAFAYCDQSLLDDKYFCIECLKVIAARRFSNAAAESAEEAVMANFFKELDNDSINEYVKDLKMFSKMAQDETTVNMADELELELYERERVRAEQLKQSQSPAPPDIEVH